MKGRKDKDNIKDQTQIYMDKDQTKVSATLREGKTTQMIGRNKVMSQDSTIHPMMIQ